ncbi:MAG: sulfotransferase [Candidatus Omnitrophica bacterium]|jgi:hypothetical protein|nr:sulfotransferase [Candidatus Omnitrophota bacterium]MDD5079444.1 sulfotransferase [Candidatus Omnitrophota bacterium]
MDPIFIIGTERSGTNLLRLILNSHPDIAIPHPPHILKNFFGLEQFYGDLAVDRNFRLLINDVARSVELHPYPWEIGLDRGKIFRTALDKSLISIYFAVYDQYLESTGKKRWGCKSTFMIDHVGLVRRYYPNARFIYMVRDCRDVAVSAKKTIFNRYCVYYTARLWKKEQQTGIYWLSKLPKEEIFLLRYEGLLTDPEKTIRDLCAFLDEPYVEDMLFFFTGEEAKKSSGLSSAWANTSKPILKGNFDKFKKSLKPQEVSLIETMAGEELDHFSYNLTEPFYLSESRRSGGVKFKLRYLIEETALMIKVQLAHLFRDKNAGLRLKKFWFLKFIGVMRRCRIR